MSYTADIANGTITVKDENAGVSAKLANAISTSFADDTTLHTTEEVRYSNVVHMVAGLGLGMYWDRTRSRQGKGPIWSSQAI